METNMWILLTNVGALVIFFASQYRKGKDQSTTDLINLLQSKDEAQSKIITDYQNKFDEINKELGYLRGLLNEKEKKVEEYKAIFEVRDPEQKKFMQNVTEATVESATYMKESNIILQEIRTFMSGLNSHLLFIEDRNRKVDKVRKTKI